MSNIGKKALRVIQAVHVKLQQGERNEVVKVCFEGPANVVKEVKVPAGFLVDIKKHENSGGMQIIYVLPSSNHLSSSTLIDDKKYTKVQRSIWGTFIKSLSNAMISTVQKHRKILVFKGVGFKIILKENKEAKDLNIVEIRVGYSHNIILKVPANIHVEIQDNGQRVLLSSNNKEELGQFAANVQSYRIPEPYKGKGIFIVGQEHLLLRKEGKRKTNS